MRASDGMTFAVKGSPPSNQAMLDQLVEHLEALKGSKAVQRIFEKECPPVFHGHNVLCTAWTFGVRIFPDRLTDEQVHAWLDDYAAFSAAMQKVKTFDGARPIRQWHEDALKKCRSLAGGILRRLLTEMDPADCDYRPELLRVIHGDYHYGNSLFVDGKVDAYLDLEEFRQGYPADDILRNIVCATEHLRWYAWGCRRMLQVFALAVRQLPYSRHEWMMAINARFISKLYLRTWKVYRIGLGQAMNLAWRTGLYPFRLHSVAPLQRL